MALRPLNNNNNVLPPVNPQRPMKQAKVTIPVPKQPPTAMNDENAAPLQPPNADAAVEYVPSENLEALSDPDVKIQSLMEDLESKDWLKVCESLNIARRFAIHHSTLLFPNLEKVILVLIKSMKNPRSALCKTSIMTASDVFNAFGDQLLVDPTISTAFDQLLLQLLLKASQDKKFVCEEADKTLKAMVGSMPPLPLLHKLRTYVSHANPRIRAKAAVSMSHCISNMGLSAMEEFGLVPMVQLAANMSKDKLPEAREAARSTVMSIYEAFTENKEEKHETWQDFCHANLSALQAQSLIKIVTSSQ